MKYFGTDGIRGTYGQIQVSEPFYKALGKALVEFIELRQLKKIIVIGTDTRISAGALKSALIDGIDGKLEVLDLGILPTPALAYGVLNKGASLGAMITASHNPYSDNGIKFFDSNALKIDDQSQESIEEFIEKHLDMPSDYKPKVFEPKSLDMGEFAKKEYVEKMSNIFEKDYLKGLKICIDTANGGMSQIAGEVFRNYSAEVFEIANVPNGMNINEKVGSQNPENLTKFMKECNADIGFANDGDGDRVVVCDDNFSILEGEEVLGLIALQELKAKGTEKIVTTMQSNLGLDASLNEYGIKVYRSGIGDRLVMQMMLNYDCNIGGENSGHYIFKDISPCGDGLAASLAILAVMKQKNKKLSQLRGIVKMNPIRQCALNINKKIPIEETKNLYGALIEGEKLLKDKGRILLRYSGTENKIRILVEGSDELLIEQIFKNLQKCVEIDL